MRYRRVRWLLVVVFVVGIGATGAAQSTSSRRAGPPADVARLYGTWSCTGRAAGSSSVESYARAADGSVVLTNRVHTSVGADGTILETFTFDPATRTWTLSAPPNPLFGGLKLSASRWTGDHWVLTGTEVVRGEPRLVRIVYTDLGGSSFRREHQAPSGGAWADDGAFVCTRSDAAGGAVAAAQAAAPSTSPIPVTQGRATTRPVATVRAVATPPPSVKPSRTSAPTLRPVALARPVATVAPTPSAVPTPSAAPTLRPVALARPVATVAPTPSTVPIAVPSPSSGPPMQRPAAERPTLLPVIRATPSASAIAARPSAVPRPSVRSVVRVAARPAPTPRDRAYALVGAKWDCESVAGEPSTHTYTLAANGAIALRNDVRVGDRVYPILETYRFDPAQRIWTTAVRGGGYVGTAPPWLHEKWIFDGIETERGRRSPVRMIYTELGDQAFRRDFQLAGPGGGQIFVSETCKRI